jgi:hypothetical protein
MGRSVGVLRIPHAFCAVHVLANHPGHLLWVSRNHKMGGFLDRHERGSCHALRQACICTYHRGMTFRAPQNERRHCNARQGSARRLETTGCGPIKQVDGRHLDRVVADPLWPGVESTRAAVEVYHCRDRCFFAGLERIEVGVGHLAESPVMPMLSHAPQQPRPRSLDNHQT